MDGERRTRFHVPRVFLGEETSEQVERVLGKFWDVNRLEGTEAVPEITVDK